MLDVQKNRGAKHLEEIDFTRKLMWGHMIFGAVMVSLFLFHELFPWFAGSLVWYGSSLAVMYGFMCQRSYCRLLLALMFLCATAAGLFFIVRVYPASTPPPTAMIPQTFIPLWLGLANLTYALGTLMMLFSTRIRRAGQAGFLLW